MPQRRNYLTLPNMEAGEAHEEPEEEPKEKKKTSNIGTFLHLVKGNVGTGILAGPMAISNFGLVAAIIGIILLDFFCVYCMDLLVFCSKLHVPEKTRRKKPLALEAEPGSSIADKNASATEGQVAFIPNEKLRRFIKIDTSQNLFYFILTSSHQRESASAPPFGSLIIQADDRKDQANTQDTISQAPEEDLSLDYASTAFEAFCHGPKYFRSWATFMRFAVNLMLLLTQFGFCCVYFLFVGESLQEILANTKMLPSLKATTIMCIELPFMILLNFIPNLDMLTAVSTTAVGLQSVGLLMMFVFFVTGDGLNAFKSNNIVTYLAPIEKWPLFFGSAMFSFEGIGVVLPLENAMKRKRSFKNILISGMTLVVVLYLLISVFGYLKYGKDVKSSITFNLPTSCFSEVIRLLFALAIFLTYPLQMYVPFTFIIPYMKEKLICDGCNRFGQLAIVGIIRAILVFITFAIAVKVPMLDLIISFIGAVASSFLALIFPPLIHAVTIWKYTDIKRKFVILCFDAFVAILGTAGMFVGAFTSISEMTKRNTTVASYEESMFSGFNATILPLSSNHSTCCTLFG